MTFQDFLENQYINVELFIHELKKFKRMSINNNQLVGTESIKISDAHFALLSCNTAQEIHDKKITGLLNAKIHLPFFNNETKSIIKVTFNYFHILFAAKEHLKISLLNFMNQTLCEAFPGIKKINFDSGSSESAISRLMMNTNCKFISDYLTVKIQRDYLKIIMTDDILLSNPYLLLLFTAPFDYNKVSKTISLFNKNNMLNHEVSLYTLSDYNIFRLNDSVFDDKFICFLDKHNLLHSVRTYCFNPYTLKFQNEKSNFITFNLNLADMFYLKENPDMAEYLATKGVTVSFSPSYMMQLHKNALKSETPSRGDFKEKTLLKIAYFEKLIIKESINDFPEHEHIKKRL